MQTFDILWYLANLCFSFGFMSSKTSNEKSSRLAWVLVAFGVMALKEQIHGLSQIGSWPIL